MLALLFDLIAAKTTDTAADMSLPAWPVILFTLFILGFLFLSVIGWAVLISYRFSQKDYPVVQDAKEHPPWGMLDVVLGLIAWFGCQIVTPVLFIMAGRREWLMQEPTPMIAIAIINGTCLFAVAGVSAWLAISFPGRMSTIGWSIRRLGYDMLLGIGTFVMAAPFIYGLMGLSTFLSQKEYEHPLFEAFKGDSLNIVFAFFVAVIVAPFVEEFLFRVLLQGFMQSVADQRPFSWRAFMLGRGRVSGVSDEAAEENVTPALAEQSTALERDMPTGSLVLDHVRGVDVANPYASPGGQNFTYPRTANTAPSHKRNRSWWPIVISGTLFGLAHFEYGVSWIPLIVFGFVLGWLYRMTGRIWPSLFAHMFSNSIAMIGFTITTFYGPN